MSIPYDAATALHTTRLIPAAPERVFEAFQRAELLARWWGPAGFTNTFQEFDFRAGGRWVFVMHGPDGTDYPNENVFREIEVNRKVVIEHVVAPFFRLTVTLEPRGEGTHLEWVQDFGSAEVAERLGDFCRLRNEQNLDRLESVLR